MPSIEQQIVLPGESLRALADAAGEVGRDLAADVGLGEAARNVDRAHDRQRVGQAERGAHQDRVLVGGLVVDDGVALADGLDEADVQLAVGSAASSPSATVVLPRFMPVAARYSCLK